MTTPDPLGADLAELLGPDGVTFAPHHHLDDLHDESLHPVAAEPYAVAYPRTTEQVAAIARLATRYRRAITPRGSGTGLSGGAMPVAGGIVVSFARMNQIRSIDASDHIAVVEAGVTLRDLDAALVPYGLRYPVYPGETSGSLGGNVNTNAGGMRAVRHGVTRHHVTGLELVLADGTVLTTGGPVVKNSSGYDLTQLVIGSEGTLALVTAVTLRLSARLEHAATVLAPFASLEAAARAVPPLVASGLEPSILEYVDLVTMRALTSSAGFELGIDPDVAARTTAYLVIVVETRTPEQLEADLEHATTLLSEHDVLDAYVLEGALAQRLIEAREKLFWVSKAAGANDIVDVVVPRSQVPRFLADASDIAARHQSVIAGCGHIGDGNVHLSVFQPDDDKRHALLLDVFGRGIELGGQISGEHGIGRDKQAAYLALTDPSVLNLQRRIKSTFDPWHLLNPYRHLDERPAP